MLKLTNLVKTYVTGDTEVQALKGIDLEFRQNEFVSILGPSGCGKTTLLNVIGGLDRYDSGELCINGKSTKKFTDHDWDSYRNHSIGFVFQSYNLIPHQSVLSNVELALTLSGVSKSERRKRAIEVLEKVGLGDQLHKKPNQMSGGQMQRVAIARALVNNPEILLADEPTGALDSETSVQIMELLKEISGDKLVIMVTHNPELAENYSSRIIKLLDGRVIDDSDPYTSEAVQQPDNDGKKKKEKKKKSKKDGKTSMSMATAFSLSINNLMTKKARTILVCFAGSIGIIGIALILSLSNGFQSYINKVEEDTLSSYPITIEQESVDLTSMAETLQSTTTSDTEHEDGMVYTSSIMSDLMEMMLAEVDTNNLASFKDYIENGDGQVINDYLSAIEYSYDVDLNIYKADTSEGVVQVNPSTIMESMGMSSLMSSSSSLISTDYWDELLGNQELLESQYDLIAGSWPESYNEVVIVVDKNNEINELALYSLGIKDQSTLSDDLIKVMNGEEIESEELSFTYDELLDMKFKLVLNGDYYIYSSETDTWVDISDDDILMKKVVDEGVEINVVGIIRPSDDAVATSISGVVGYTHELVEYVIEQNNESEIAIQQMENPDIDVFTGLPFESSDEEDEDAAEDEVDLSQMTEEELAAYQAEVEAEQQQLMQEYIAELTPEEQEYLATLSDEELQALMEQYLTADTESESTYEDNLTLLGIADLDNPSSILLYPIDFNAKDSIEDVIADYNNSVDTEDQISYTDLVGLMMSSISTIINIISYVLIAFVAISLVVSSIMIGIITYISVLERTKEIGILRSIGASKKDISRVFNAETAIIGLVAGALGIALTLLIDIPIDIVIENIAGISNITNLPWVSALILVIISVVLTIISGLIPSGIASRKDPVEALRTE